MTCPPRVNAATPAEWPDLIAELDRWGEAGRVAELWWRDDDAVTKTPQLAELLRLAGDTPLALATIPADLRPELPVALVDAPQVSVLQHGWRHANHAGSGKKSEYPEDRPMTVVASELGAGRARLETAFGTRALAVLVPPWNRIADRFLPLLPAGGMAGVSRMASPANKPAPPDLVEIDVHVDLTAWRGDRGFIGTASALGSLIGHLRVARKAERISRGPIGILTHHLVMDRPTVAFVDRLIEITRTHAAARWASPAEFLA